MKTATELKNISDNVNKNRNDFLKKEFEMSTSIISAAIERAASKGIYSVTEYLRDEELPYFQSFLSDLENQGFKVTVQNGDHLAKATISWHDA